MRVLAMAHAYPPHHNAGGEVTIHSILRHLAARGHDVHVQLSEQADGPTEDYYLDGVHIHHFAGTATVMPFFTEPRRRAHVVISHLENVRRAGVLCEMYQLPLVHLIHNNVDWTKGRFRRGPTNLAVFNAEWIRRDFETYWSRVSRDPMPPSIVVHPPCFGKDYRTKHGQHITLINLNEEKGGRLFWQLAKALPDKKFLGVRGAYGVQVEWWLKADGRPTNVTVIGHQRPEAMREVYGNTKVLLMPSSYESYGRVAIEAAHSGIPTIAQPTPGLLEALGDAAGAFVDRDDVEGWIAAIRYLTSPRGFSAASRRARELAESLDPMADLDRLADALEGVVAGGLAPTARRS